MKDLIETLFKKSIEFGSYAYTAEQKEKNWIGNEPASLEDIAKVEQQLGVIFPDDYKELLMITNGFLTSCDSTEPSFISIQEVLFYRDDDIGRDVIEIWGEMEELQDTVSDLKRAILVGGTREEQQFLLIPPSESNSKWKYWKFAMWLAGEEEYETLTAYIHSVIGFLEE